jgi:hypothetical protein
VPGFHDSLPAESSYRCEVQAGGTPDRRDDRAGITGLCLAIGAGRIDAAAFCPNMPAGGRLIAPSTSINLGASVMIRKFLLVAAVVALATPAFASQCPTLMAKIDAALQTAKLSDADKAKVAELRKKGEEEHAAGKMSDSEAALGEALKILGM